MSDQLTIVGNIASVPERRELPGGATVIEFRLATTERRFEQGVWVDAHTNWYRVNAYRGLADNAHASFEKGQRVIVHGRFRLKQWEAGEKRGVAAEIDADALGHDLLFGATTFRRTSLVRSAPLPEGTSTDSSALNTEESAWSSPPSSGESVPETVPAGWGTPVEEETPF